MEDEALMEKGTRTQAAGFKAVIMDMDGTMIDSEPLHEQALFEALRKMDVDPHKVEVEKLWGLTVDASVPFLRQWYGKRFDSECFLRTFRGELSHVLTENPIPMKPGVNAFLERMRSAGFGLAVASSSDRTTIDLSLERTGLSNYFTEFVGGDEVENGKPAPDIFLIAARQLGVEPGACLVVEDSPAGVEAAYKAGMRVYWIPDGHEPTEHGRAMADGVFDDLVQALGAAEEWLP